MYKIPLYARNFLSKSSELSDCWAASSRVFFSQPGARRSVPFIRSDITLQKSAMNVMHTFVLLLLFRWYSLNWRFVIIIWSLSPSLFPAPPPLPSRTQASKIICSRHQDNRKTDMDSQATRQRNIHKTQKQVFLNAFCRPCYVFSNHELCYFGIKLSEILVFIPI